MSLKSETPHFVWVYGMANRPEPQKWSNLDLTYATNRGKLISYLPLSENESALPIAELEKIYPLSATGSVNAEEKDRLQRG